MTDNTGNTPPLRPSDVGITTTCEFAACGRFKIFSTGGSFLPGMVEPAARRVGNIKSVKTDGLNRFIFYFLYVR